MVRLRILLQYLFIARMYTCSREILFTLKSQSPRREIAAKITNKYYSRCVTLRVLYSYWPYGVSCTESVCMNILWVGK